MISIIIMLKVMSKIQILIIGIDEDTRADDSDQLCTALGAGEPSGIVTSIVIRTRHTETGSRSRCGD